MSKKDEYIKKLEGEIDQMRWFLASVIFESKNDKPISKDTLDSITKFYKRGAEDWIKYENKTELAEYERLKEIFEK